MPDDYAVVLGLRVGGDGPEARVALAARHTIVGRQDEAVPLLSRERCDWPAPLRDSADVISALARYGSGRPAEGVSLARASVDAAADDASPSA